MYSLDINKAHLILGYSDVFTGDKPNLPDVIFSMNMHKTISVISELIQIREAMCDPVNVLGMEFSFPFEIILKRDYCGMDVKSPENMMSNVLLRKDKHIISLQMLLILLKKVFIYGNYETLKNTKYEINDEDYRDVIMLQLLVADEISEKHQKSMDTDHFLYATYHLNYQRNVAAEFLRMYYIMEVLSTQPQLLSDDIKAEYRNYYEAFYSKYGITPTEYSSLLFWELQYYYSNKNVLSKSSCWRNIDVIYGEAKEKEKTKLVIELLKKTPDQYKEWASQTEDEEWNFTSFYTYPFVSDGGTGYISISEVTLINAFFEKMFWLIRECYPVEDSRAMAFFGRLYERYIQDATKDACTNSYMYIDEFTFKARQNYRKSSDAYIKKGTDLLVVEAKGFSVLVDCMAKNEKIEKNNDKLFVKPILQADECLCYILDSKEEFEGIQEIFVVSVTLDNINAVPNYYEAIHKEIADKKKCEQVHYYFNFSIEEYEMLLFLIEKQIDIFSILREYFTGALLEPFSNYIRDKVPSIGMTTFMEGIYSEATNTMKNILL